MSYKLDKIEKNEKLSNSNEDIQICNKLKSASSPNKFDVNQPFNFIDFCQKNDLNDKILNPDNDNIAIIDRKYKKKCLCLNCVFNHTQK